MPTEALDALAVLDWIVSRHVHAYLDTAGRPVGEGRSSAFEEVQTEMRSCPYPGSRYHHVNPMNASAIQGMPPWQDLLAIMAWLSHRHRERYGRSVTTSDDLARITSAGIMLVDYLALRREKPVGSREVPLLVSGVYKVCLGYQLAYLSEKFAGAEAASTLPDAAGFLEYLEQDGVLIGQAEVCSCPPVMIVQSYEVMTQVTANVSAPRIEGFSIDWDRFDDFAEAAGEMWREMIVFAIQMPAWIPQLDHPELPDAIEHRLNALLLERGTQLLKERRGLVIDVAESVQDAVETPPTSLLGDAGLASKVPLPGSVAATVVEWLWGKAPEEIALHQPAVDRALQLQLGPYEDYEAGVLESINGSLEIAMKALDLESGPVLTPGALSQICGRTMRDWAAG